jgi:hypothetical protein
MVDTNIKLSTKLEFGLLLGLNFVLFSLYQYKQVSSIFTVYSKASKELIFQYVVGIKDYAIIDDTSTFNSSEQCTFHHILYHPQWNQIHLNHVIMTTDKNMSITVVAKT